MKVDYHAGVCGGARGWKLPGTPVVVLPKIVNFIFCKMWAMPHILQKN